MEHQDKITWMALWAAKNNVQLKLEGECGLGRECVGIISNKTYPDYDDEDDSIWTPEDAYHKHPCVAVLGRGERAESQLYEWLKWFDDNGYTVEVSAANPSEYRHLGAIAFLMGKDKHVRMTKKQSK